MESIDFTKCETQKGDSKPEPFSFLTDSLRNKQVDCHITYTNKKTHKIIKDNIETQINFTDLTSVLYFLQIKKEDFIR